MNYETDLYRIVKTYFCKTKMYFMILILKTTQIMTLNQNHITMLEMISGRNKKSAKLFSNHNVK